MSKQDILYFQANYQRKALFTSKKTTKSTVSMPNDIRDLREVTVDDENGLIFEKNVSIPLKISELPIRCNVYRPIDSDKGQKYPVLVTYGPYGKDIWYGE